MRRRFAPSLALALLLALALAIVGCSAGDASGIEEPRAESVEVVPEDPAPEESTQEDPASEDTASEETAAIDEAGTYTSKDDVALYLHTYGHLPDNFVRKGDAMDAGWKTEGLSLDEACPGMSIGGDRFSNREGLLPSAKGRTWYECDIDYTSGNRNAKRVVYSSDGLIYYTDDHYQSFERLY